MKKRIEPGPYSLSLAIGFYSKKGIPNGEKYVSPQIQKVSADVAIN